jgi:Pvc16 N-terminal domain
MAMINEIDDSLRNLLEQEAVSGAGVDVAFDAPTREWASRLNTPTIDCYLYDIREDLKRRSTGMIERRDERGIVTERSALPRFFKLAYLITAWTQRPDDEHRLLSAALSCFVRFDVVPEQALTSVLRDLGAPVALQMAYPPPEDRQVSDVWSSLGGDLKPSIDLVVTLAIQPAVLFDVAKAVMAPLRLRAKTQITYDAEDEIRHLRDPTPEELDERRARGDGRGGGANPGRSRRSTKAGDRDAKGGAAGASGKRP